MFTTLLTALLLGCCVHGHVTSDNCDGKDPVITGTITDPDLSSLSGVASSRSNEGLLWVHNDGGDDLRIFGVNEAGKVRADLRLVDSGSGDPIENVDPEDMALSREQSPNGGSNNHYLWLGDIGNVDLDMLARDELTVYKISEPLIDLESEDLTTINVNLTDVVRIPLKVVTEDDTDEAVNFETLMVDSQSGKIILVSRTLLGKSSVYSFVPPTATSDEALELTFEGEIGYTNVVGGDISFDGDVVLLKTTHQTFMVFRKNDESVFQALAGTNVCLMKEHTVDHTDSGIAFNKDEDGYYTVMGSYYPPAATVPPTESTTTTEAEITTPDPETTTLPDLIPIRTTTKASDLQPVQPYKQSLIHRFDFEDPVTPDPDGGVAHKASTGIILLGALLWLLLC